MNAPRLTLNASGQWRVVLLLMGFAALAHFNRVGISVAGSEWFIPRYGISETAMGTIYTAFLVVYTLGMVPSGWLIDRIGSARVLLLLALTMGTFVALVAPLGWLRLEGASLWWGLIFIRGVTGLWSAPLHPGAAHVVSEIIPTRGRATANGLITCGALVGIAFCYPVFGALIDWLTWPNAFLLSGLALAAYGLMWRGLAIPQLPHLAHSSDNLRLADGLGPESDKLGTGRSRLTAIDWTLLARPHLWLLTLSYAAYGYFQYLFFYWMGYYFESVLQVTNVEARGATFIIMLSQGAGMALGGWSTDFVCRGLGINLGRRAIVMSGMGFGAIFALAAVGLSSQWGVTVSLALSMAALGVCEGVFWTTATDVGGRSRGFAGAFMNAGGNVGGLISPVLTPALAQSIGWSGAIVVACAISAVGGLVWLGIRPAQFTNPMTEPSHVET